MLITLSNKKYQTTHTVFKITVILDTENTSRLKSNNTSVNKRYMHKFNNFETFTVLLNHIKVALNDNTEEINNKKKSRDILIMQVGFL